MPIVALLTLCLIVLCGVLIMQALSFKALADLMKKHDDTHALHLHALPPAEEEHFQPKRKK
jgi:hypothetical protein